MSGLLADHGVALIVTAVLVFFGVAAWLAHKRRKELEAFAAANGFIFDPHAGALDGLEDSGLPFFRRWSSTKSNLLRTSGPGGGEMLFFDYSYSTGHGKRRRNRRFAAAIMEVSAGIPSFELRPENFLDSLIEMAGFKDIDLPQFPGFSRAYRLTGDDQDGLSKLFSSGPAAFLEGRRGLIMNGGGRRLALIRRGHVAVRDYPGFIEEARAVFTSFPSN